MKTFLIRTSSSSKITQKKSNNSEIQSLQNGLEYRRMNFVEDRQKKLIKEVE